MKSGTIFSELKMAPPGRSRKKSAKPFFAGLISGVNSYGDLKKLFLDPDYSHLAAGVLLFLGKHTLETTDTNT